MRTHFLLSLRVFCDPSPFLYVLTNFVLSKTFPDLHAREEIFVPPGGGGRVGKSFGSFALAADLGLRSFGIYTEGVRAGAFLGLLPHNAFAESYPQWPRRRLAAKVLCFLNTSSKYEHGARPRIWAPRGGHQRRACTLEAIHL